MMKMRGVIASWFMLLSLVMPIGGALLPVPTSDSLVNEAAEMEERSASDETFAGVVRVSTGEKARRTMSLVMTFSHPVSPQISLSAPPIERAVTAFPSSHARPVYQHISVYRI